MLSLARLKRLVQDQGLFVPGQTLVLGVSGGPDSLCLLDLLHRLAGEWELGLHVAHLDHQLRPESAEEAEFVRAQAAARGLPFHTDRVDVRSRARAERRSLEDAARHLRYAFLARTAQAVGAPVIAVAHTADDQAETVLMHLLRGTGLAGLRGMRPKMKGDGKRGKATGDSDWGLGVGILDLEGLALVRPLLTVTRAEVEAYNRRRGLRPVLDASNQDVRFRRNRVRHELLPLLETYNPNLRAALSRLAEITAGEAEIVEARMDAVWAAQARVQAERVEFDRADWRALNVPEQRHLLRRAMARLRPAQPAPDFRPLEQAVRFSRRAAPGRACDLGGGLQLRVEDNVVVVQPRPEPSEFDGLPQLTKDGSLAPGWRLTILRREPGEWTPGDAAANADAWCAWVDAERLGGPLEVRARRPGDRLAPLGMGGRTVKLSDLMINLKVPRALRARWPLVVCGAALVWVPGLRLSENFRVRVDTRAALLLRLFAEKGVPDGAEGQSVD